MGVSKNNGTPKSSILIGFSIINHPFWGTPICGNIHIMTPPGGRGCFFEKTEVFGVFRAVPEMFDAIGIVPWTLGTLERKWGQKRGLTKKPGWF